MRFWPCRAEARRCGAETSGTKPGVILGGATGNPWFSNNTAAALLAHEIMAKVTLKTAKVGGIYDCSPKKNPQMKQSAEILRFNALQKRLKKLIYMAFSL